MPNQSIMILHHYDNAMFCNLPFCDSVLFCYMHSFVTVPFSNVSYCTMYRCVMLYRFVTNRFVKYRFVAYRFATFRFVTYRFVTYCFVTYRFVTCLCVTYHLKNVPFCNVMYQQSCPLISTLNVFSNIQIHIDLQIYIYILLGINPFFCLLFLCRPLEDHLQRTENSTWQPS